MSRGAPLLAKSGLDSGPHLLLDEDVSLGSLVQDILINVIGSQSAMSCLCILSLYRTISVKCNTSPAYRPAFSAYAVLLQLPLPIENPNDQPLAKGRWAIWRPSLSLSLHKCSKEPL